MLSTRTSKLQIYKLKLKTLLKKIQRLPQKKKKIHLWMAKKNKQTHSQKDFRLANTFCLSQHCVLPTLTGAIIGLLDRLVLDKIKSRQEQHGRVIALTEMDLHFHLEQRAIFSWQLLPLNIKTKHRGLSQTD